VGTPLRFATDATLIRLWPAVADVIPREKAGKKIRDWDGAHQRAMNDLERWLRTTRGALDMAELGRLGLRSKARLEDCAGYLALHYLCTDADIQADDNQLLERKASYFWNRAEDVWRAESQALDYDEDRSGAINEGEKNKAFPARIIRG